MQSTLTLYTSISGKEGECFECLWRGVGTARTAKVVEIGEFGYMDGQVGVVDCKNNKTGDDMIYVQIKVKEP